MPVRRGATGADDLAGRFAAHLSERGWLAHGNRAIVACSGGVDSLVLLHLLRFSAPPEGVRVEAAHFDHGMRPASAEDAEWLQGVAEAWEVPLHVGRAAAPPVGEAEARELRYRFLEELRGGEGSTRILTAHHADDQIETVLFRMLRGTGIEGLRGIPERRERGILRPLLPFARSDLEAYAERRRLRPREDPTNQSLRFARNRIRHELVPLLERIHPGARASVLRLARHAQGTVELVDRALGPALAELVVSREGARVTMDRDRFLACGELERAELLRRVADSIGMTLSDSGTAAALQFMSRGSSGGGIRLAGAGTLGRSFDRFVLERDVDSSAEESPGVSRPLVIPSPGEGAGEFVCRGRRYEARWGVDDPEGRRGEGVPAPGMGWEWAGFRGSSLAFPLHLRGWRAGDRTRTAGGGRKLKKLLGERRIAREDRSRLPLLVDAEGLVLWIPGMHLVPGFEGASGGGTTEGRWFVAVRGAAGG